MSFGTATAVDELRKPPSRMREPGIFVNEPGKRLARERDAVDLAGIHCSDRRVHAGDGDEGRLRCGALGGAERRGIGDAPDPNTGCVRILDFCELRTGRYEICTLQKVVGIAEVDDFLALFVDRHEGHVPFSACG